MEAVMPNSRPGDNLQPDDNEENAASAVGTADISCVSGSEEEKEEERLSKAKQSEEASEAKQSEEASTHHNVPQSPPPDGGWLAWAQCIGSFFLFFNGWGIVNAFGTFQAYYETNLLQSSSSSQISWIGSVQAFLLMFGGYLTAPLLDDGHLRPMLAIGTFLLVFGTMMTSICTEYWQFLLAQGFCVGFGCGSVFIPSVSILPSYFSRRKSLVLGIGAAGASLGGILYPIIFHTLQPQIGFAWTTRLIGFIMLATNLIPLVCMRVRYLPPKRRPYFDAQVWKDAYFTVYILGVFFAFAGAYIPFFYVQLYAIQSKLVGPELGFYLLSIMNAGSFFSRTSATALADRTGPLNMMVMCGIACIILAFCMSSFNSSNAVIVFAAVYGFCSGPYVSLCPAATVDLSPDHKGLGVRMGMMFCSMALGLLVGNPIAGVVLSPNYDWFALGAFTAVLVLIGTVLMASARVLRHGWGVTRKA